MGSEQTLIWRNVPLRLKLLNRMTSSAFRNVNTGRSSKRLRWEIQVII